MTTTQILDSFLKGNSQTNISEKQRNWLLGQAQREQIKVKNDGFALYICLHDCHYRVQNAKTHVSGYGGTRGTETRAGIYSIKKYYTVRFTDTGIINVHDESGLHHLKTESRHPFEIINQL